MLLMDFQVGWVICLSRPFHWCIDMAALRSPWMISTRSFFWCLPPVLAPLRVLAAVSFEIKPDQSGSVHIFRISLRTIAKRLRYPDCNLSYFFSSKPFFDEERLISLSLSRAYFFEWVVLSASVDILILRGTKTWFVRVERTRLWLNCCLCGYVFWRVFEGCHFVFNS